MLRLAVGLFLLAILSAVLGFGGVAGALSSLAVIAFYVFLALLVLALIASAFGAHTSSGAFGAMVVAGLIGAGVYAWVDNGMTAERLGASIDRTVVDAKNEVADVAQTAGAETEAFVERVDEAADEATDGDGT